MDNTRYDPLDSLEKEVVRFMATNQFNAMDVTGFYIQSRCVINELKELRKENERMKYRIMKMREAGESMRCELEEYQANYGYSYEDDPCDKWESALSALPNAH